MPQVLYGRQIWAIGSPRESSDLGNQMSLRGGVGRRVVLLLQTPSPTPQVSFPLRACVRH
jgi:hypothetical protein